MVRLGLGCDDFLDVDVVAVVAVAAEVPPPVSVHQTCFCGAGARGRGRQNLERITILGRCNNGQLTFCLFRLGGTHDR